MKKLLFMMSVAGLPMLAQLDRPLSGFKGRYAASEIARLKTDDQITVLERRLNSGPRDVQTQGMLAAAFLQKLRETMDPAYLQRSAAMVDRMLTADANNYLALRLRNELDMQRHDFPRVAERSRTLLERNPSDAGTVGILGDALMELGRYDEAAEAYKRMLELQPNLASYSRVAYHRFVTGKSSESLAWMNQAVAAGSDSPENLAWGLVEFGDLLFKTGRVNDAEAAYNRALSRFSSYHRANAALGRLAAAGGDYGRAISYLKKAEESVPLPEYAGTLEALYRRTNQAQKAGEQMQLIETVNKLMAANQETMNRNLSLVYADAGRNLDRANELAQAEFKVRHDVYTYDALGWVQFKRSKYAEAREASQHALELHTAEPMFYYHAGLIELASGDRDAAKRNLRHALELNPNFDFRYAPEAQRVLASLR